MFDWRSAVRWVNRSNEYESSMDSFQSVCRAHESAYLDNWDGAVGTLPSASS